MSKIMNMWKDMWYDRISAAEIEINSVMQITRRVDGKWWANPGQESSQHHLYPQSVIGKIMWKNMSYEYLQLKLRYVDQASGEQIQVRRARNSLSTLFLRTYRPVFSLMLWEYHAMPYHTILYVIIPCHTILYYTKLYIFIPYHTILYVPNGIQATLLS